MKYFLAVLITLLCVGCASTSKNPSASTNISFIGSAAPVVKVTPIYSKEALKLGVSGVVSVKFVIGENGKPTDISILDSAHESLTLATLIAVERTLYLPKHSGKVAEAKAIFTINKPLN